MNESQRKAAQYVDRMERIMRELADLNADLKEIAKEAKDDGFDAIMLKRWAKARADAKVGKLAATVMTMHTLGETLHPDLFGVLAKPEEGDDGVRFISGLQIVVPAEHDADGVITEHPEGERAAAPPGEAADAAAILPQDEAAPAGLKASAAAPCEGEPLGGLPAVAANQTPSGESRQSASPAATAVHSAASGEAGDLSIPAFLRRERPSAVTAG